jgi:transcriptional regulator with XRE-family HTH domain
VRQVNAYDAAALGRRLRQARQALGLSMTAAATLLGVSHAALSYHEGGKGGPELSTLAALARLYDVSLDWLVFGREQHCETEHRSPASRDPGRP